MSWIDGLFYVVLSMGWRKAVGMYAVDIKPISDNSITTLCWPAILATFPSTPLKVPSITFTVSPPL